MSFVGINLV